MATKTAKGKITGLLALTCEGAVALNVGDPVMVSAAYTVILCERHQSLALAMFLSQT